MITFERCVKTVYLDLLDRHRQCALRQDEEGRQRVFHLLDDFVKEYPFVEDWSV